MDRRTAPLHVLMVEDSQADAELILRAMRDLGIPIEHRRVGSEAALRQALAERMAEVTAEYGERRETDGYLSGMRTATTGDPPTQNVRSLRPKR